MESVKDVSSDSMRVETGEESLGFLDSSVLSFLGHNVGEIEAVLKKESKEQEVLLKKHFDALLEEFHAIVHPQIIEEDSYTDESGEDCVSEVQEGDIGDIIVFRDRTHFYGHRKSACRRSLF